MGQAAQDGGPVRKLHVVALSEDGRHVVLATTPDATQGGFRLALDDRLRAAVKGELLPGRAEVEPMSVREIQSRLRAGESVDELLRSGGASRARVERFGAPVLSERAQVVDKVRRAVLVRGRRGASALPLGEAVDLRLSELASVRADSIAWTAARGDDGVWTVSVSWSSRGRTRTARWRYDVLAKAVVPVDPGSATLAHVDADTRSADGDTTVRATKPAVGSRVTGARVAPRAAAAPPRKVPSDGVPSRAGATPAPTTGRAGTTRETSSATGSAVSSARVRSGAGTSAAASSTAARRPLVHRAAAQPQSQPPTQPQPEPQSQPPTQPQSQSQSQSQLEPQSQPEPEPQPQPRPPGPPSLRVVPSYEEDEPAADIS